MQSLELLLFGVISALSLGLIASIMRPRVLKRRLREQEEARARGELPEDAAEPDRRVPPRRVCPACQRHFTGGERFCPHDAKELAPVSESAAGWRAGAAAGVNCARCGRSYDGGKRFCAFDGEELGTFGIVAKLLVPIAALGRLDGKICPTCSQRYPAESTFCGRDGASLVSMN